MLLKQIQSVVRFVPDIDAAAIWYAELFQVQVEETWLAGRRVFVKKP